MCLRFSILFLVTYIFPLFARAYSQVVQASANPSCAALDSDACPSLLSWAQVASLLNPTDVADKFHIVDWESSVQGPPSHPETWLGIRQSLEDILVEEARKTVRSLGSTIALLESVISGVIPPTDVNPLLRIVAKLIITARDDFQAEFPLPATAPGHVERVDHVSERLERFRQLVIKFAKDCDVEPEAIEPHLTHVEPFLRDVGVLVGDVTELYPAVVEALVLHLSAVLFPEAVFLRSLVILYLFGPYVLGKDAVSGWLLKHVSETLRP